MGTLKEYGDLFERLGLSEMSVEEGNFKLRLVRNEGNRQQEVISRMPRQEAIQDEISVPSSGDSKEPVSGTEVKSPLLGIFYGSAENRGPLKEGDPVKEGDVMCTIEAMKMMNDVKAPKDGIVKAVSAKDGDLVEYNQTLFVIE